MISVSAQLDRKNIDRTKNYEGHLMVSIGAEDKDFDRTPVDVVLVLDVSGSMSGSTGCGKSKIELLKDTATKLVRNLTDKDKIAIVAFASDVSVVLSSTEAGNKEPIIRAIEQLHPTSCTNMSGGFIEGLRQIDEKFNGVKRIMLLTDGLANAGVSNRDGLLNLVKERDSESTLSTFGFGMDADQELLADMAKAAGGNFYFINDRDIGNVFARELGGIVSCQAQNITVRVTPNNGHEVVKVLNDFTVEDEKGTAVITAGDIYVGETKHVLVRMKISKPNGDAKNRPFSFAKVEVSYDDLGSGKRESTELRPKVKSVKPEDADKDPILEVQEQVAFLEAAGAQVKAVEFANNGDFDAARSLLEGMQEQVGFVAARGSKLAESVGATLNACKGDFEADRYTHSYGATLRSAAVGASRYRASSGVGTQFMSSLCSTSAQRSMEAAFTDDSLDVTPVEPSTTSGDPNTGGWTNPNQPVVIPGPTGPGVPAGPPVGPIKPGPFNPPKPGDVLKPRPDKPEKEEKKGFSKQRQSDR